MHAKSDGKVVSLGVDWITATAADAHAQLSLLSVAVTARREDMEIDGDEKPWAASGFNGWATRHVQYGTNGQRGILRLGGERAAQHWRACARAAESVSRIDLQATVEYPAPDTGIAASCYRSLETPVKRAGRPCTGRIVTGTDGGASCYVGSRSSAIMGRVYDKGIEAGIAPKGMLWRWEIEVKKPLSGPCVSALLSEADPMESIRSRIAHFFRERTGAAPFLAADLKVRDLPPEPSTSEQQLEWLRRSVAPTVRRLLKSEGYGATLRALGLGEVPDSGYDTPPDNQRRG